jgi:hypothetical protein
MMYTLTIDQKPTYLHVTVTGRNSRENVERYIEDILRECTIRNCFRVLVEERLEGPRLGTLDVFDMVSNGTNRFRGRLEAMAYVDVNAEGHLMKFAEDVAVNRGFLVTVFSTVADAEKWLLRGRSGETENTTAEGDKQRQ